MPDYLVCALELLIQTRPASLPLFTFITFHFVLSTLFLIQLWCYIWGIVSAIQASFGCHLSAAHTPLCNLTQCKLYSDSGQLNLNQPLRFYTVMFRVWMKWLEYISPNSADPLSSTEHFSIFRNCLVLRATTLLFGSVSLLAAGSCCQSTAPLYTTCSEADSRQPQAEASCWT